MANSVQFDLFDPQIDFKAEEIKLIDRRVHNVQRGLFRRFGELSKEVLKVDQKCDRIENRLARIEAKLKEKFGEDVFFDGCFHLELTEKS